MGTGQGLVGGGGGGGGGRVWPGVVTRGVAHSALNIDNVWRCLGIRVKVPV